MSNSSAAQITLLGYLGRDPELKYLENGEAVVNFTLALDFSTKDRERTEWVGVSCWNGTANAVMEYLSKGDLVMVTASRYQTRAWTDNTDGSLRSRMEVTADRVKFLVTKKKRAEAQDETDPILPH